MGNLYLHSYFEARKELFKGLAIEKLEKEWIKYPVIHLDLSGGKCLEKDALERYLREILNENARYLGVDAFAEDINVFLNRLITQTFEKYNRQVVLLLDEYDAPLLDVVHEDTKLSTQRAVMQVALLKNDIEKMLDLLKTFLCTIPYLKGVNSAENAEGHWQQLLYVIFSLLGANTDVEVHTSKGRVDMVARTTKLYLFELKLNKDAQTAMKQIELKDYASRFALSTLPIVKVGINFDVQQKNITDWEVV